MSGNPGRIAEETTAKLSPTGLYVWTTQAAQAAEDYAREFHIPLAEVREWFQYAQDKAALLDYMRGTLQVERDWRQAVADERAA